MHYYRRNIGDYSKKAGRLSMLQHGAYNLLIDCCYDREDFPTRDDAIEWTWASTKEEIEAVDFVLSRFFDLRDDGKYVQKRIAEEVEKYQQKRLVQAENGKKGGRPKKAKPPDKNPMGLEEKPTESQTAVGESLNHEPVTTNHQPVGGGESPDGDPPLPAYLRNPPWAGNYPGKAVASIPDDFYVNDRMREWAIVEGFAHLDLEAATVEFVDYWKSRGDAKADWEAAWRGDMRKKSTLGWSAPQRCVLASSTRDTSLEHDLTDTAWVN